VSARGVWSSILLSVALPGCVNVSFTDREPFDVNAVTLADIGVVRGDIDVTVEPGREGELAMTRWAFAKNEARAEEYAQQVQADWSIADGVLSVRSDKRVAQAGLDVVASLHPQTNLDLRTDDGNVTASDVEGVWVIEGDRVVTARLAGEGDVISNGGASLEIWPYETAFITVDAAGELVLALPAFGPYDLVIDGDPDYPMTIQDLGWDVFDQGPAYVAARREPGTIRIDIIVRGGPTTLVESTVP